MNIFKNRMVLIAFAVVVAFFLWNCLSGSKTIFSKNEIGRYVVVTRVSFWLTDGSRKDDTLYILDTKTGEYRTLY